MSPRRPSAPRVRSDDRGRPDSAAVEVLARPPARRAPAATTIPAPLSAGAPESAPGSTASLPATGPDVPVTPTAPAGRKPATPARRRGRALGRPGRRRGGRLEPTRPERRARAAAAPTPPAEAASPAPRPAVTVRSLALALVLLVAFIVVAPTLRAYLAQREQYRALEAELAAVDSDVGRLERELRRWEDPGYVEAQARERLSFVRPGEMAFRVIDPETVVGDAAAAGLHGLTEAVDQAPVPPWYLALWDSVVDAGEPVDDDAAALVDPPPATDSPPDGSADG